MVRARESRVRFVVINFIRVMLVYAFFIGIVDSRNLVLFFSVVGFLMTFVPGIARNVFGLRFDVWVDVLVLLFVFGLLIFGETRGLFGNLLLFDVLLHLGGSVILGFVALAMFYALDDDGIVRGSPFVLFVFVFCVSFSAGTLWEVLEFVLDWWFGFGLQNGDLFDTMVDVVVNGVGSFVVSVVGYYQMKTGKSHLVSSFVFRMIKRHSRLFRSHKYFEYSSGLIERLIAVGEGDGLEFKSTLRRNLYTKQFDKTMEHSVLKTVVGYLNSKGGTLLVGVDDSGEVLGVEQDMFASHDKLKLYVTSLLKENLGSHFLSYVSYELLPYQDRHVLKIDCEPSDTRVFLKWNGKEEFYVRHGASTIQLSGNDLIEYVARRFG